MGILAAISDAVSSSTKLRSLYTEAQSIFIVLDIALFVGFILLFLRALETRPRFQPFLFGERRKKVDARVSPQKVRKAWDSIRARADSKPPQSYTLAIIEADKMVDAILKQLRYEGEHMADRLERLGEDRPDLATIERLWRAHRVRNELVHTPGYDISHADAESVLRAYEAFLKEMELLA